MGFRYLNGKNWNTDFTREERFFCAVLFEKIRQNPANFIDFLNKKLGKTYERNEEC